jgi:hypothetical protein
MIGVLSLDELELDCLLVIGGFGKIDGKLKQSVQIARFLSGVDKDLHRLLTDVVVAHGLV